MEVLVVPGLLLVALAIGAGAYWVDQRHREAMAALAASRGWTYQPRDDSQVERPGEPFGRGHGRRAEDVLSGEHRGRPFTAFAYSYRTTSTDGQGRRTTRTHRYAVGVVPLPAFVPFVELTPANLFERALGLGVALESEDFNRRYRLEGDARLVHDLLPPVTVAALLDAPDVALRLLGAEAVTWSEGRLDVDEVLARLDVVHDVLDGVPSWVWKDLGAA